MLFESRNYEPHTSYCFPEYDHNIQVSSLTGLWSSTELTDNFLIPVEGIRTHIPEQVTLA